LLSSLFLFSSPFCASFAGSLKILVGVEDVVGVIDFDVVVLDAMAAANGLTFEYDPKPKPCPKPWLAGGVSDVMAVADADTTGKEVDAKGFASIGFASAVAIIGGTFAFTKLRLFSVSGCAFSHAPASPAMVE
jgi:hypothetical protein